MPRGQRAKGRRVSCDGNGLNRFATGSGPEKDLICLQDPDVNVCSVKPLSGDLDMFAFTGVGVRGLIEERWEGVQT